ncbi:MAG: beta-lactamase family protein, partial [Melioribacteraceae bacterium]|nr:beta-lactamase family protein [Melioribacteraceae bacterium]
MKYHKIIFLLLIFSAGLFAQPNLTELDKYISNAVTEAEAAGLAVAIVKDSQVVFSKAYGYADIEKEIPLTTGSLFNIASCTKAFTAAVVAKLVDEGKLSWDDKVV